MNLFEFLLVMISIVLGLGISELLGGIVRILRGELVAGKLHSLWILITFQLQAQLAWGIWGLRSREAWRYPEFILVLLAPMALYLAAAVLYPGAASSENLDSHLIRYRRPFYLLHAGYLISTMLFGWFLFHESWLAWSILLRFVVLAALITLSITDKRSVHWAVGSIILASHLWWTYYFTFMIGATPTGQ